MADKSLASAKVDLVADKKGLVDSILKELQEAQKLLNGKEIGVSVGVEGEESIKEFKKFLKEMEKNLSQSMGEMTADYTKKLNEMETQMRSVFSNMTEISATLATSLASIKNNMSSLSAIDTSSSLKTMGQEAVKVQEEIKEASQATTTQQEKEAESIKDTNLTLKEKIELLKKVKSQYDNSINLSSVKTDWETQGLDKTAPDDYAQMVEKVNEAKKALADFQDQYYDVKVALSNGVKVEGLEGIASLTKISPKNIKSIDLSENTEEVKAAKTAWSEFGTVVSETREKLASGGLTPDQELQKMQELISSYKKAEDLDPTGNLSDIDLSKYDKIINKINHIKDLASSSSQMDIVDIKEDSKTNTAIDEATKSLSEMNSEIKESIELNQQLKTTSINSEDVTNTVPQELTTKNAEILALEKEAFKELIETVLQLNKALDEKTQLIIEEEKQMKISAESEVASLDSIIAKVTELKKQLKQAGELKGYVYSDETKSETTASSPKEAASPKNAFSEEDFNSLRAGVEQKAKDLLQSQDFQAFNTSVKQLESGVVKVSADVRDLNGNWKSFSATVSESGDLIKQKFSDATAKKAQKLTKMVEEAEAELVKLSQTDMKDLAEEIQSILALDSEKWSITVNDDGTVAITEKLSELNKTAVTTSQTFASAEEAIASFNETASLGGKYKIASANEKKVATTEKKSQIEKDYENILKTQSLYDSATNKVDIYYERLAQLNNKISELGRVTEIMKTQTGDPYDESVESAEKYIMQINELQKLLKSTEYNKVNASGLNKGFVIGDNLDFSDPKKEIQEYVASLKNGDFQLKEFRKTATGMNSAVYLMNGTMESADKSVRKVTYSYNTATGALREWSGAEKEHVSFIKSATSAIANKIGEIFKYVSSIAILYQAFNSIKQGIGYISEMDTALTELRKVSNLTTLGFKGIIEQANEAAKAVGSTSVTIVQSAADWARLGYSIKDAMELAKNTSVLMNVSEFTEIGDATDSLVSILQAFNKTADQSMEVIDLLNTIGNNYAISTSDLAESLKRSSSSLVVAGKQNIA